MRKKFETTIKITTSALLIFSILCAAFSVTANTDKVKDNPLASFDSVADMEKAQADSVYSLASEDIKQQEEAALNSFNSVSSVESGISQGVIYNGDCWHFARQDLALDEATGLRLPTGNIREETVYAQTGWYSTSEAVRLAGTRMQYVWDSGEGEGLGIYNSSVFTFAGYATNHVSALAYLAYFKGRVRIEPTTVQGLGSGYPFYTLQAGETAGFAIYKNNQKVWPVDSDYYTLTETAPSVTTPEIFVDVEANDKIYFKIIPLNESWGYFTLNPKTTYVSFNDDIVEWSYNERDIAFDEASGQYLPTGEWTQPTLYHANRISDRDDTSNNHPNYLVKGERANSGYGTYGDGRILTFISGKAVGIGYTVPKSGTVKYHDATSANLEGVYWGFNAGGGYTFGLALYKNGEKIFPAEDDYLVTNSAIKFPTISDIKVNKGDKLIFEITPLSGPCYAFAVLCPQVTYQTIGTSSGSVWAYESSAVTTEEGTGYNVATGQWTEMAVGRGIYPAQEAVIREEAYLKNWLYTHKDNFGIGVYAKNIITFLGNTANALTYTAPMNGNIRLYDSNGGTITTPAMYSPFWTLDNETVGITIYQNDKKVWPTDGNYYVLNSANTGVAFPDLSLNVSAGDKIRIAMHPLNGCGYGYMLLGAPRVDYLSTTYSTAFDAVAYQETKDLWTTFNDSLWSYEEKAIALTDVEVGGDTKSIYMPTGDWFTPQIQKGVWFNHSEAVRAALPNAFYIWDGATDVNGSGIASYKGRVVTYIGHENDAAPTLTYTAPLTGSVKISGDDLIGRIEEGAFLTLHEGGMVGFAIYKNNEKIWPAEGEIGDFHVFNGDIWDAETQSYIYYGDTSIETPEIDIDINAGDKLRFTFVPMEGMSWGFMALDPHIQYTAVNGWGEDILGMSVKAPSANRYFAIEDYDFSDMVVNLHKADGTAIALGAEDYTLTAPKEIGKNTISVEYENNGVKYTKTFNVTVIETLYGDLDMDGAVNATDLANLKKQLLDLNPNIHLSVADVNDDGDIDLHDIVRLKRHLADSAVVLGPAD